jgi:hypothetical protein
MKAIDSLLEPLYLHFRYQTGMILPFILMFGCCANSQAFAQSGLHSEERVISQRSVVNHR